MTERFINLVVPLGHEPTAMRTTDTAGSRRAASGAAAYLGNRARGVDSTTGRGTSPTRTTPGTRTSTTATRTTTTATTSSAPEPSADRYPRQHADFSFEDLVRAYLDCRRNKRNSYSAQAFEIDQERNLALRRTAEAAPEDFLSTANSYFGLLGQATHSHHDRARLGNAVRDRGHSVNYALTKTYRRSS